MKKRSRFYLIAFATILYLIGLMLALSYVQHPAVKPYVNPHPIDCLSVAHPERYDVCAHPM